MNAGAQTLSLGNAAKSAGSIWYQLHSEREAICEALIREPCSSHEFRVVVRDTRPAAKLKQRLRLINDALDRLMAGSYGSCIKCGRVIEDANLDSDPAIAFCNQCAGRTPTQHQPKAAH
jgi:hypothetical protein